ncbi:hypothetical protein TNCV_714981 [Trichonephila clavipes]|nr:hypothetical protein TNCV_714981 [Trichonephila clavipes]
MTGTLPPLLDSVVGGGTPEARKLIAPLLSQTYSQAVKSSITSSSTQTDENITKNKVPTFKTTSQPASSILKQNKTASILTVPTSPASTQEHLLLSASTVSESQPPIPKIPISNDVSSTTSNMVTPIESSSIISICSSSSSVQPPTASTTTSTKQKKEIKIKKKKKKELFKKLDEEKK